MDLYAAIDLRGGACVRLVQGDYAREKIYAGDPVVVAREFADDGAPWIHVVDLDAARTGRPENRAVVAAIADAVDVPVQAGGGIRDEFSAESLLAAGVARIVLGTAALEDPGLLRRVAHRHPGRVAVGLDARHGEVAVRGWTARSGRTVAAVLAEVEDAPLGAVVVTDIARDGMLGGPDVDGLSAVLAATRHPVVASGGVSSLADLRALTKVRDGRRRLTGAIVGTALHEGLFSVREAVVACEP
ncbi:MAG TPA: 1-(5-phosphoribosyl)-5-[(5-phosphoribosylamino)methylideneamino]imidazole-4-carboxamide isomerase [Acidimicrobiales bacterium]|nr:1-(5-phosphoribosyl)-5-[(5-phosphoribosylamino)methylideneamino]imidazole-4-carboxamide isomerase [Acidimicrobiales bacterium]